MPSVDLQDRAQYLALALFSQAIVEVLMQYVDENKTDKLRDSLREALQALKRSKNPTVSPEPAIAAFNSYEHLTTLNEVWSQQDRDGAIKRIKKVLSSPANQKAKTAANELIDLFSKLQVQALWNFEQPRPVSPKAMQRLCRLA